MSEGESTGKDTKTAKTKGPGCLGVIALAVAAFALYKCTIGYEAPSQNASISGQQPSIPAVPVKPTWTPPDGYSSAYTDNGVPFGYKWVERPSCELGDWCFGVDVVTSENCPHLYASITILDKDDTNIGWTNDTAQGIRAGEKVRLVFNGYQSGVRSARLAETKCY